jgi:hypothetical protein
LVEIHRANGYLFHFVANGCVPRLCPVRLLYSFDAAANIAVKLAVEGSGAGLLVDISDSAMAVGGDVELGQSRS